MTAGDYVPDPEMLRRAAEACRNMQKQAEQTGANVTWVDWVPARLAWMAAQIDGSGAPQ